MIRITSRYFCAGAIRDPMDGRVLRAAPIIRYMIGWTLDGVASYCRSKNWTMEVFE